MNAMSTMNVLDAGAATVSAPATRRPRTSRAGAAVAALLVLALAGCEPADRRPGMWLSGTVATVPADWNSVELTPEVQVETGTWYGIPHSVTVVAAPAGDVLYVPSIYDAPAPFPGNKRWNANIARDPAVRLRSGATLYELAAQPVTDPAEFERGLAALAARYPFWAEVRGKPADERIPFVVIRMQRRS